MVNHKYQITVFVVVLFCSITNKLIKRGLKYRQKTIYNLDKSE